MNARIRKSLTRKLVALTVLLAVMFGSVLVVGITRRNAATEAAAFAEEIDTSDLELVSSGNKLENLSTDPFNPDVFSRNNLFVGADGTVTIDPLTNTATFSGVPTPGFFSYGSKVSTVTVESKLYLYIYCKADKCVEQSSITLTKDMVTNIVEKSVGLGGATYCSGFTLDLTTLFDFYSSMSHGSTCASSAAISNYSGSQFALRIESNTPKTVTTPEEFNFTTRPIYGKIMSGNVYKLPTPPAKEGYRFTGWYTDPECTVKYEGDTFTDDITLYAGYVAAESFTVTYIDGDVTTTETVDYGSSAPIPAKEKTGYTFVGWFYPDNVKYTGQAIKTDVTLTAVYTVKIITIRFVVDGEEYKSVDVPYGSSFMEVAASSNVSPSDIQSVTVLKSVGGVGSTDPADDQSATDVVTSDLVVEVRKSAADKAKDDTTNWFATTWQKIADFFVNAWNAVCEHFRTQWKWWAIGGGSLAALVIIALSIACYNRR